jgi:hypothetical protein
MKEQPTIIQLAKLPKWAQRYIKQVEGEREAAVFRLNQYQDRETPSNIWSTNLTCIGEKDRGPSITKQYFHATDVEIEHKGVHLTVGGLWNKDACMTLSWRPAGQGHGMGDIAFVPTSYQQARLVNIVYDGVELDRLFKQKDYDEKRSV